MLKYDAKAREVQLVADRAYVPGEPVYAWCGPQPNRRLLLNYAIVDDDNPYGARPAKGRAAGARLQRTYALLPDTFACRQAHMACPSTWCGVWRLPAVVPHCRANDVHN